MGRSLKVVLLKQTNMKLLLELAAAGLSCAAPEADPAFAYSIGHHPLVYSHPVTYTVPTVAYHPYAYGYPYGGLVYGRKKREAEAEPEAEAEADPWLAYGYAYHPYAYSAYYHPYAYAHLGGCRNYLGGLVPCAGR